MYTAFNPQRQNFAKYDDNHYLLFLDEKKAEQNNENNDEIVQGYTYTGDQVDGSTLITCSDVTYENRRSKFIAGLIGNTYTQDDQIALLANGEDSNQHAEELAVFHEVRRQAKKAIDELLARTI